MLKERGDWGGIAESGKEDVKGFHELRGKRNVMEISPYQDQVPGEEAMKELFGDHVKWKGRIRKFLVTSGLEEATRNFLITLGGV